MSRNLATWGNNRNRTFVMPPPLRAPHQHQLTLDECLKPLRTFRFAPKHDLPGCLDNWSSSIRRIVQLLGSIDLRNEEQVYIVRTEFIPLFYEYYSTSSVMSDTSRYEVFADKQFLETILRILPKYPDPILIQFLKICYRNSSFYQEYFDIVIRKHTDPEIRKAYLLYQYAQTNESRIIPTIEDVLYAPNPDSLDHSKLQYRDAQSFITLLFNLAKESFLVTMRSTLRHFNRANYPKGLFLYQNVHLISLPDQYPELDKQIRVMRQSHF